jgi:hypothetical protein
VAQRHKFHENQSTGSNHSNLYSRHQHLSSAKATHSDRICETVRVLLLHLPQIELSVTFKVALKWKYPVNRPVTCLAWDLLSPRNSTVLFAENSETKLFVRLCPGVDCQHSRCSMHAQLLMAHFATLSEMLQVGSGLINRCSTPLLPASQQSHYLQSVYVPVLQWSVTSGNNKGPAKILIDIQNQQKRTP